MKRIWIALSFVIGFTQFNYAQIQANGDIISPGSNSWRFHTPDDGRTSLYIASGTNSDNWNWENNFEFKNDGTLVLKTLSFGNLGSLYMEDPTWIRMNKDFFTPKIIRTDNDLQVGPNGDVFVAKSSTRNVGIGTTSPERRFTVEDGAKMKLYMGTAKFPGISEGAEPGLILSRWTGTANLYVSNAIWLHNPKLNNDFGISFVTFPLQENNTFNNGKVRMFISNETGNIGIGTTDPQAKLHVNGDIKTENQLILLQASNQNNTSPGIVGAINDNFLYKGKYLNHYGFGFYKRDSESYLRSYIADFFGIDFFTNGSQQMTIAGNGNVGIGTTDPQTKLHVNGLTKTNGIKIPGRYNMEGAEEGVEAGILLNVSPTDPGGYNVIRFYEGNGAGGDIHYFGKSWGDVNSSQFLNLNAPKGLSIGDWNKPFVIFKKNTGNVGIGTTNPDERLTVKGKIHAEEVKVDLQIPADYVFQKYYTGTSTLKSEYKMPTLEEVEQFTKENHHLPNVPSAKEIQENGLQLSEMTNLLLQKVEELTLYTIEQKKMIENQEKRIQELENKLKEK